MYSSFIGYARKRKKLVIRLNASFAFSQCQRHFNRHFYSESVAKGGLNVKKLDCKKIINM